jgi:hypothetical protein
MCFIRTIYEYLAISLYNSLNYTHACLETGFNFVILWVSGYVIYVNATLSCPLKTGV